MKTLPAKKLPKTDREQAVLFGLIELYLKSGKPIGSQTLQENGFESLSSATIRNYFGKFELGGYLKQPHTSGGRIPTAKGLRLYADTIRDQGTLEGSQGEALEDVFKRSDPEIVTLINQAAEVLSDLSKCAVFVSMPRFDQDFIQDIRLLQLDAARLLSVVITDFGMIHTETIYLDQPLSVPFLSKCESYFLWRLNKGDRPQFANEAETKLAQRIYNEIMVRHVVGYANFPSEDILRCGFSKLLAYSEFADPAALVNSLALLEDEEQMRAVLRECSQKKSLTTWIGDELCPFVPPGSESAVISIPYRINQSIGGAIALLGPMRLPYRQLFGLAHHFSELLSQALTQSIYKFKITFRAPAGSGAARLDCDSELVRANRSILLEDQR